MTSGPVEADSLSKLTYTAGNPPRYPRNPAEQKREPLVLYIARVPGSHDIILTPLKPDLKNLKEIDVNSCLYYIHRNLPSDLTLLETELASKPPQEPKIARKPLPNVSPIVQLQREKQDHADLETLNGARVSFLDANKSPNACQTKLHLDSPYDDTLKSMEDLSISRTSFINRTPVGAADSRRSSAENEVPDSRRPLGPRPISTSLLFPTQSAQHSRDPSPFGHDLRHSQTSQPQSLYPTTTTLSAQRSRANSALQNTALSPLDRTFSLTLIRRDTQSGHQWNVGTITGAQTASKHTASALNFQPTSASTNIQIHLTTSGYHQFTDTPMKGFHREVHTEWSGFWDTAFKRHRRGSSNLSRSDAVARSSGHSRGTSDVSTDSGKYANASLGQSYMGPNYSASQHNSPQKQKSKMKSYSMVSPWNGRCEFTTSQGGRSLKCKHTLNSNVSQPAPDGQPEPSVTVSELRYNLPSVGIKLPKTTREAAKFSGEKAQKAFKRTSAIVKGWGAKTRESRGSAGSGDMPPPSLPPRPSTTIRRSGEEFRPPLPQRQLSTFSKSSVGRRFEDIVGSDDEVFPDDDLEEYEHANSDYDGRLDLSLGRESAGGGNRGKRAKLGKLIIFDEGFKMMDLIVAANMGVWWAGWETEDLKAL